MYHQSREQETFYRHIIQWFGDSASDQCPFSIHRLVELGKAYGKHAGDWYGPSSVAYIFRYCLLCTSLVLNKIFIRLIRTGFDIELHCKSR